ncbi:MAG: LamG domain-containing protein [Celeribacter sp.]|jgi:hypothetical protein
MQIGLSLSLGANLRSGGASFNPASLFANGDGALIQRRSDALFVENTASTHAVDTNAVGFATDGSEGAGYSGGAFTGLGADIMVGGEFSSATGWTLQAGWSISSGELHASGATGNDEAFRLDIPIANGTVYVVDLDITSYTGGSVQSKLGGNAAIASASAIGSYTVPVKAGSGGRTVALNGNDFTGRIDDVSVREIPGNHATQATTSYKPTLQTGGLLFDGNDDRLTGLPAATTSGTLAARFNGSTASKVILGSQAASDGRCFLALDASGKVSAGIGGDGTSTITGGADIRDEWHTAAVTWDGSTVTLYLDGVSVYSAAQSGAVNTTVAMMLGALNADGSAAAFWAGTVSDALVIDRVLTTDEITNLNSYWSA